MQNNIPGNFFSIGNILEKMETANLDMDIVVFNSDSVLRDDNIFPLRLEGLSIILCKDGEGEIGIDLKVYPIRKNTLIVIQPKNYIQLAHVSENFKAHCMVCSHHIIEDIAPKLTDILPLLLHNRTEPVTQLSENDAESIDTFYRFLQKKMQGPKTPFLKKKLLSMLQGALFEMMDIQMSLQQGKERPKSRKEEIMAKFILAVSEHFRTHRQVNYYANKLCISAKHLSSVVKEISGRTAGEWIENYVTMEAKVLLRTTDMTIQEIATNLNFLNQSFFGKYFKHITGVSPTAYRKANM